MGRANTGMGTSLDMLPVAQFARLDIGDALSHFMLIDLDAATYPHTPGTKLRLVQSNGDAVKSNSGSQWVAQLCVILRINATDADLGILTGASIALLDSSLLSVPQQLIGYSSFVLDLEVANGDFANAVSNAEILGETVVNTGVTLEDPNGDTPVPAVGDLIIRIERVSGGGTLGFAFGVQYFVEE